MGVVGATDFCLAAVCFTRSTDSNASSLTRHPCSSIVQPSNHKALSTAEPAAIQEGQRVWSVLQGDQRGCPPKHRRVPPRLDQVIPLMPLQLTPPDHLLHRLIRAPGKFVATPAPCCLRGCDNERTCDPPSSPRFLGEAAPPAPPLSYTQRL